MFMFAIELAELHDVTCDWCDEAATSAIYSRLPVQHACDDHLGDWLRGQAWAIDGHDIAVTD